MRGGEGGKRRERERGRDREREGRIFNVAFFPRVFQSHPGVPQAVSVGNRSTVFFANPKSAILISVSSVSIKNRRKGRE